MPAVRTIATQPGEPVVDSDDDSSRPQPFVLDPRGQGLPSAISRRLHALRPTAIFVAVYLVGYVVLAAAVVALGLLLTEVLLPIDAVLNADQSVPTWLEDNRSPGLTDVSAVTSIAGDIPILPGLVIVAIIVGLVAKKSRIGIFLLAAILAEVTLYRVGTLAVPRTRPDVERLDVLPIDHSFPSGHVAASFVVYIGLALLITSRVPRRRVSVPVWTIGVGMVIAVAVSRMYRGMHHPLDVLSGSLLGAGSLLIALIAIRAYGEAEQIRSNRVHTNSVGEIERANGTASLRASRTFTRHGRAVAPDIPDRKAVT